MNRFERYILRGFDTYRFTYLVFKVGYLLRGYPRWSRRELEKDIYGPANDPDEVYRLEKFTDRLQPSQALYVIFSLLGVLKNSLFPVYMILIVRRFKSQYSYLEDQQQLKGNQLVQIGCLWTNCTRLSETNKLFNDLLTLPVYKLCYPDSKLFHPPTINIGTIGVIIQTLTMFVYLDFSVLLPIGYYLFPSNHEVGVFIFATKAICRTNCELARKYLIEVINSFRCNREDVKHYERDLYSQEVLNYPKAELVQLDQLSIDYDLMHPGIQSYISDCVPFNRQNEYKPLMARRYWLISAIIYSYLSVWVALAVGSADYFTNIYKNSQVKMDEYIRANNCSIWRLDYDEIRISESPKQILVDVSKPETRWTLYLLVEYFVQFIPPAHLVTMDVAMGLMSSGDLKISIAEQRDRLELAIELAKMLSTMELHTHKTKGIDLESQQEDRSLRDLRALRLAKLEAQNFFFGLSPINLFREPNSYGSDHTKEFSRNLMVEYGANLDVFLNILIKTYVWNRIFVQHADRESKNVSFFIFIGYLGVYACLLMIFIINSLFNVTDYRTFYLAATVYFVANILLVIMADFQVQTKHLIKQM